MPNIDSGVSISCTDIQRKGGLRYVALLSWSELSGNSFTFSSTDHSCSSVGAAETAYLYEFKDETAKFDVTATKENGQTSYDCSIEMYFPRWTGTTFQELMNATDECLIAVAQDTNGKNWILGVSEAFENVDENDKNQTFGILSGMEGSTGAAYTEESGITVTFSCRQWELPREYTGTYNVNSAAATLTVTLS
jgi:hypothetical protein